MSDLSTWSAGPARFRKSTLARGLAERSSFQVVRSDVVRKQIAASIGIPLPSSTDANIYTAEWNAKTYSECLRRAEDLLLDGQRVLVDATFRNNSRRRLFLDAAIRWGVPAVLLLCRVDVDSARRRLEQRRHDVSDADWQVYQALAQSWQPLSDFTRPFVHEISSGGSIDQTLAQGLDALRVMGLHGKEKA
jgi:predicted kinase